MNVYSPAALCALRPGAVNGYFCAVPVLVNNSPINDNSYDSPCIDPLFPVDVDL